jgi:hypothetical protein
MFNYLVKKYTISYLSKFNKINIKKIKYKTMNNNNNNNNYNNKFNNNNNNYNNNNNNNYNNLNNNSNYYYTNNNSNYYYTNNNNNNNNNYNNNPLKKFDKSKPPTRTWVPEIQKNQKNNYIRVMSYNILCDSLASISTNIKESELKNFPFLNWEIRRKKILEEIKLHSPDILCIQELERDEILLNSLGEMGFDVKNL